MTNPTKRGLLAFASAAFALAAPLGCFSDYSNDCSRNPELPCFWGGAGGTGGAGGATTSAPPKCGDGTTDAALGEACDDGNTADCDGCRGDCSALETGCGDAFVCPPEACDDGSANSDTGPCTTQCKEPACGDGTVQGDEACDDGNTADGDGCSKKCVNECTTGSFQNALLFFDEQALHCYLRVNGSKKSWVGAQNECKLWSPTSDLLGFSDSAEVDRVAMGLPATAKAWTGGTDKTTAGVYGWSNGEPFPASSNLWATGQPDDDATNSQQCLSVDGNYGLADDDCASLLGFVCELDLATLK